MKIATDNWNNIIQETKLRKSGTGTITTIPKNVIQVLGLELDDVIIWEIDNSKKEVKISIKSHL